jgi:hypothetical protein
MRESSERDTGGRAAGIASVAVLSLETLGSFAMWAPLPIGWLWVGARVFDATSSVAAAGFVALLGLLLTAFVAMTLLSRVDRAWVALRRRAGHEQRQGALGRVVVVSAALALAGFLAWYVISQAYVMPFMPTR